MKIKNLAFYGVMAAILGSVGTARADDSTIIASKGYVDAYAQKQSDRVETTWANTSSDDKSSTDKYPSMATLNDAITSVDLSAELADLDLSDPAVDGKPIVSVSQADGQVSAAVGDITTAGIRSSALATSGTGNNNLGTAGSAVDTKLPTEKAVADALALKEDVANKQAAQTGATVTRWDTTAASDSDAYTSDTKYPTVKAVAQQIAAVDVSAAVQNGTNALELADATDKAPSVTAVKGIADNGTTAYTTRNASNQLTGSGSSTKVPTTAALVGALKDLDMAAIDNTDENGGHWGQAVTKISQVDGKVYADTGVITGYGLANGAVSYDKISTGAIANATPAGQTLVKWDPSINTPTVEGYTPDDKFPTVKAVAEQIAAGSVAPNNPITPSTTDHSIVTYDAKGLVTGGISLPGLNDINNTNPATCTAGSPCVLSFYVDNGTQYYKWTNMDTEGLSGNPHVSGS